MRNQGWFVLFMGWPFLIDLLPMLLPQPLQLPAVSVGHEMAMDPLVEGDTFEKATLLGSVVFLSCHVIRFNGE